MFHPLYPVLRASTPLSLPHPRPPTPSPSLDHRRILTSSAAVFGPAATTWFRFLQRNVNLRSANATILARVGMDQGLFAPTFIGVFLSSMAVLEGGSVKDKLDKSYVPALTANYMIWPFVQLVNFKFVPLHHRVLFVNVVSIAWNCYLSFLNSSSGK